jgi:predicted HAD superfamily Cof-like phosphohydrolase
MKMQGWQRMVREFHSKFGQPVVDKPKIPGIDRQFLRERLMREELDETVWAMTKDDLVEIADGLADLIYVALGTAIEYGIDMEPVFREVHRSNMAKLPGNMRADGKVTKPEGWEPPRIAEILAEQSR